MLLLLLCFIYLFFLSLSFFGTLGFIVMKFYRMNEVSLFFLHYMFIVVVITISMDAMCRNDYICAMLVIKP